MAASIAICGERRERKGMKKKKRHNETRPTRSRYERECMFSLVTVTRDALARCIGRRSIHATRQYRASMYSLSAPRGTSLGGVRAYHDLDSVAARACFDIAREEHVSARRISEQECPCERGIREEKEINNWNSKDISLISEIVRGERGIARLVTITLECKVRARSKCNLCATRII